MSDFDNYKPEYVGNGLYGAFIKKQVGDVIETTQNLIVHFLTPDGQTPIVGQGVVLPKNLGFTPQKGMKAIYDSDDSMAADGKVLFYTDEGKLLFAAERKQQKWSAVQKNAENNQTLEKTQLMEIFQIRVDALKEVNPEKFANKEEYELLLASSMAAQEWIEQLNPAFGKKITDEDKKTISDIHNKYGLDRGGNINPFLVQDLVCMYLKDVENGIIDKKGNLNGDAFQSEVMMVSHNSKDNGVPVNGVQTITKANTFAQAKRRAMMDALGNDK